MLNVYRRSAEKEHLEVFPNTLNNHMVAARKRSRIFTFLI